MIQIATIVWGVRDMQRALAFWTAALGYHLRRDPDVDWALLVPEQGQGRQFALKLVVSAPEQHQRHHMDLYTTDQQVEVDRLHALGAKRVEWRYEPGADYVVLADPDGNRFCVIQVDQENMS